MQAHLLNTELNDRVLWYDGTASFPSLDVLSAIQKYSVKYVDEITPLIANYNKNVIAEDELLVKHNCELAPIVWNLPIEYKDLDVFSFAYDKLVSRTEHMSEQEFTDRATRLVEELNLYQSRNLIGVLRAIIFVINTLTANNVVWGIGRGSSVSSYLLYLIGVHDVDSYFYELEIEDFLHD